MRRCARSRTLRRSPPDRPAQNRRRCAADPSQRSGSCARPRRSPPAPRQNPPAHGRSEEHTSELQSRGHLVCRLLLEKKQHTVQPWFQANVDYSVSVTDWTAEGFRLVGGFLVFFFNNTAPTEIYTLSQHDALPI